MPLVTKKNITIPLEQATTMNNKTNMGWDSYIKCETIQSSSLALIRLFTRMAPYYAAQVHMQDIICILDITNTTN